MSTIIPRFAYRIEEEEGEIFFHFDRFPEIVSALDADAYRSMEKTVLESFLQSAVITALSARVSMHMEAPEGDADATICDGFVTLDVVEAMKLTLYALYVANFRTVAEFAERIGKSETAARRLLDFRHNSRPAEIEAAMAQLGKRLHHEWHLIAA